MQKDRGRVAETPSQIQLRNWTDILRQAGQNAYKKDLSLVAGGVAYYLLLALFPALAALISLYCLVANPADVMKHVQSLSAMLPASTVKLIGVALSQLVSASSKSLGLGALIGMVIALWSVLNGMTGMMTAITIAYAQPERWGFFRFYATGVLLSLVVIVGGLIALVLIAGLPMVLSGESADGPARWIGFVVEWPFLIVFAMGLVALIYRYGPDREEPRWKWASPGVITATILWVVGSGLFSFYVYHFNSYNKTYGSLGVLLVLLTWLWLSVFVVLLGAEINGEVERRAKQDMPVDPASPMDQSRAKDADTSPR